MTDDTGGLKTATLDPDNMSRVLVHDEHISNPARAFALARLTISDHEPTPMGVFRDVEEPEYGDQLRQQISVSREAKGIGDLTELLRSLGSWHVD